MCVWSILCFFFFFFLNDGCGEVRSLRNGNEPVVEPIRLVWPEWQLSSKMSKKKKKKVMISHLSIWLVQEKKICCFGQVPCTKAVFPQYERMEKYLNLKNSLKRLYLVITTRSITWAIYIINKIETKILALLELWLYMAYILRIFLTQSLFDL